MITRRGVLGGTLAATVGTVSAEDAVPTLESIEAKAAELAKDMQIVLGGEWGWTVSPTLKLIHIYQDLSFLDK